MGSNSKEFARLIPVFGDKDIMGVHVEASVNLNSGASKDGFCLVVAPERLRVVPAKEFARLEAWRRKGDARLFSVGWAVIFDDDCEFVFHGVFLVKRRLRG